MAEAKIFESDSYIVTTERFVYGNKVVPLDDIDGHAWLFEYRSWGGILSIAGFGLAAFLCGASWAGFIMIVIGIALLVGAFFMIKWVDRSVMVPLKSGERLEFKVSTTEYGKNLANAINEGIAERHRLRGDALHNELSNLPSA